ncbi:phenylalanine--tRNA ligase subunit beta, partial [Aerococcus urinae]|uniref:YtpR family tRNA-binding protein n=3 Tax=Aerococcaceae TaxID=186827 RepID=UPI0025518F80
EDLSRTGLEVDGLNQDFSGLKKIVVGKTLTVEKHPNADSLHVCQVDVGQEESLQIVCGAPNVAAGQKVIVALHGARVAGNQKIKKGKLRGQESNGMLCSLQELGFNENVIPKEFANGIMILPEDAPLGQDIKDYLHLEDTVLDLDITPNRADALSMRGVAYELSAIYDRPIDVNTYDDQAFEAGSDLSDEVTVEISDSDLFPHYTAHLVKDVKIQASPIEVQIRLMKEGIRPINNVVDATNYVLLEYGQPLHAFDYDKLHSKTIAPRLAKTGEKLVTLDGVERDLTDDDLVITDGQEPIA